MTLRTYRVLRPVYWRGRVHCANERLVMREEQAAELIESGQPARDRDRAGAT
jgi:hypothetical protein